MTRFHHIGAAVLALTIGHSAQAQTMTFSHWVPATHQVHHGVELWADAVTRASSGDLTVRIFPAQQLGKAQDHYDMIASGQVDAGWFVPGYSAGRFPIVDAGELPFMISDAAIGARILHEWYAEIAKQEMSEIHFCAFATHDPGRIHTAAPITSVEDMQGVKMRPANATIGNYLADLGAVPVRLAAPEARQGVERGVVDGVTFPWHTIINFGLADALTHHLDISLYVPMAIYGLNPDFYADLSPENRAVIDAHCNPDWSEKLTADWADWEKEGRPLLEAKGGHSFIELSGEALEPWRAAAGGVYDEWAENVTAKYPERDAAALLSDLQSRLATAGAGGS